MISVPLTKGYVARVDDADAWALSHKWYAQTTTSGVYARRNVKRAGAKGGEQLHRVIAGALVGETVDHIDGDTLNCCRENLRVVSPTVNRWNVRGAQKNNKSGYLGVFQTSSGSFAAKIGKQSLGSYKTAEEANARRLLEERRLRGIAPRREWVFSGEIVEPSPTGTKKRWTSDEVRFLVENRSKGDEFLSKALGRPVKAVYSKAFAIGVGVGFLGRNGTNG